MHLLELLSFENISNDAPYDQDSRLHVTAAGMSKLLQLPEQPVYISTCISKPAMSSM